MLRHAAAIVLPLFTFIALLCCRAPAWAVTQSLQENRSSVQQAIEERLTREEDPDRKYRVNGDLLHAPMNLTKFYRRRGYVPAWMGDSRSFQHSQGLIESIEKAGSEGLNPDFYHLQAIREVSAQIEQSAASGSPHLAEQLADLDLFLTDAFLLLGCHYSAGCVNPVTIKAEWHANRGSRDISTLLDTAIADHNAADALNRLLPETGLYSSLRIALYRYRRVREQGGWPLIPEGPTLQKGSGGGRVELLRRRLEITGDISSDGSDPSRFDDEMEDAVIHVQKRHGLEPDGLAGRKTLRALNIPVEDRVRQMEINMERLRWSIGSLDGRQIVVNIADFSLNLLENGASLMSMKVVVGTRAWFTPVFMEKMQYLVFNPAWNVPDSIARTELIHTIQAEPGHLQSQQYSILRGWGKNEEQIDPREIDWNDYSPDRLPFRFRQEPGPLNPLGRIKFMFPNRFNVYLHDTPAKHLFNNTSRPFSHGCIRVERPVELAEYLLMGNGDWTRDAIEKAIESGQRQEVPLPDPINVLVLYLTSWVNEEGTVQFRRDIYGRDARLLEALQAGPSDSFTVDELQ